jgi:hypothetical protein
MNVHRDSAMSYYWGVSKQLVLKLRMKQNQRNYLNKMTENHQTSHKNDKCWLTSKIANITDLASQES